MEIRLAEYRELGAILDIYEEARAFMRMSGNLEQWAGGYPPRETLVSDIENSRLFVACEENEILGVFCFFVGEDPTYKRIFGGEWKAGGEYGVIHRIAISDKARGRGVASECFKYAEGISQSVRIDTHKDNISMQKALKKNGFEYCGIIYLESGDERLAYQKCK